MCMAWAVPLTMLALVGAKTGAQQAEHDSGADKDLSAALTQARSSDGAYISWREHIIDDEAVSGIALRGSDGLVLADVDDDGHLDIVSVHESDDEYDGVPEGHVRLAFGSENPNYWELVTLADGSEAGGAEDVAVADLNGDGHLDIVVACELAHLIYFENPGTNARNGHWERIIPRAATGRGSFIRVFLADLNGNGLPEVVTANKGAQNPGRADLESAPISFFEISGAPLEDTSWVEYELTRVPWPINARPVDLDGDGDIDVVGGSVAQRRMMWFENRTGDAGFNFIEHRIHPVEVQTPGSAVLGTPIVNGFNMDFTDINGDGRLDIATYDTPRMLGFGPIWLEQPDHPQGSWRLHRIGEYAPDQLVGLAFADIDSDGDTDLMTGGYSLGSRTADGGALPRDALGRLAWFENLGNQWTRHDFSRRQRGMFDKFVPHDLDGDGDIDFVSTRGNSGRYDGVFWLEQIRSPTPRRAFEPARAIDSPEVPLPDSD